MKKALLVISLFAFAACAHTKQPMAMAMLHPAGSQTARGMVHLQQTADQGVEVKVDLFGLAPGQHGLHIHENGDCGNNGTNAGPHFNPTGMIHGAPDATSHHAGDFGNVTADDKGEVHTTFNSTSISLQQGQSTNVIGRAVVVHANPDDLVTDPAGNSGPRIACGVITPMSASDMQHP